MTYFARLNCIKSLAFPLAVLKTLEFGLVRKRYSWIGYDPAAEEPFDEEGGVILGLEPIEERMPQLISREAFSHAYSLLTT